MFLISGDLLHVCISRFIGASRLTLFSFCCRCWVHFAVNYPTTRYTRGTEFELTPTNFLIQVLMTSTGWL